jgi:hypothetical protein
MCSCSVNRSPESVLAFPSWRARGQLPSCGSRPARNGRSWPWFGDGAFPTPDLGTSAIAPRGLPRPPQGGEGTLNPRPSGGLAALGRLPGFQGSRAPLRVGDLHQFAGTKRRGRSFLARRSAVGSAPSAVLLGRRVSYRGHGPSRIPTGPTLMRGRGARREQYHPARHRHLVPPSSARSIDDARCGRRYPPAPSPGSDCQKCSTTNPWIDG